ncbi:MarR family winged helix-turn-helix transcriptional regulator [Methyloterricola oryzae]|uniref:MarR family winged helix-turn-helix transcriptional regulator n=1 Tax=Methyloterricola oryzae TaxID=1495050 RepID=UPI0005EB5756|nr:MarR family winged helix-turn-helix transcriptional regulator [Methyloterricola oryzae]
MKTEPIYEHLERIANLLRTDTRRSGLSKGLQPVQLEALHYLNSCNRYSNTPAAVAEFLGLTKGTVSQTLGVLENGGYVEKKPDLKDRRVVHLELTESGRQVVTGAIPPATLRKAVALIPESEQGQVVEALNCVLRALQQANQSRSFGVCLSCRHHCIEDDASHRCALTGEKLMQGDIHQICREHEAPPPSAA